MRVLVTGAATPLGAEIALALADQPDIDMVLAVGDESFRTELPRGERRLIHARADMSRARSAHDLLFGLGRELEVSAVIHGPLGDKRDVTATRELLLLCERHPTVSQFIYRSTGDVYALRASAPNLVDEDQPLEFDPAAPSWIRDRVEADLGICARLGASRLQIAVLRSAEVFAPGTGSQLWDYLQSRICLRPLGFDPMINLLSVADYVRAVTAALRRSARGVYNIPGADTLPLSRVIRRFGRHDVPLPGPFLAPLYRLRARTVGFEFSYDRNMRRFHFGGILDGSRAQAEIGYEPRHSLEWLMRRRASRKPCAAAPTVAGSAAPVTLRGAVSQARGVH